MVVFRAFCSRLCAQEPVLIVLGGPYRVSEIEPGLATCKANALPSVLWLWGDPRPPLLHVFSKQHQGLAGPPSPLALSPWHVALAVLTSL